MLKFLKSFFTKKAQPTSAEATAVAAPYKIETPPVAEEKPVVTALAKKTALKKATTEKKPAVKAKSKKGKPKA